MKLPILSGREVAKVLKKINFEFVGQKGSHMHFRAKNPPFIKITVPNHKELDKKTLKSILRSAKITTEDFIKLL